MTITSVGYAGTVNDSQWANMVSRVGNARYSVDDYSSFQLTPTAGTRAATVSDGGASGMGIYDTSNATTTINFASVSSGNRWDMVVLRRTWATKVTSIAIVTGGSSKALPSRANTPGTVDEQPLYLVRVIPGSTLGEIVDLRCIAGDAGLIAFHDLARSYLNRVGTIVRIGSIVWERTISTTGSATWISSGGVVTPLSFEGRLRRSDGALVLNAGNTFLKWQSVGRNTVGANTFQSGTGATITLPAGLYMITATLKVAIQAQNWSQLVITTSGGTILAGDQGEYQTPPGYSEMGATRLVHATGMLTITIYATSNNGGVIREDGVFRAARLA